MSDDKKERNAQIKALVGEKYTAIGNLIMPVDAEDMSGHERAMQVLAGQLALGLSVCGNISSLSKAGAIDEKVGGELLKRAESLMSDMHDAFHNAAEVHAKKRSTQRDGSNVVDGHFPGNGTVH